MAFKEEAGLKKKKKNMVWDQEELIDEGKSLNKGRIL